VAWLVLLGGWSGAGLRAEQAARKMRVPSLSAAYVRRLQVAGYPLLIVDVRSEVAYASEHIVGALHFAAVEMQAHLPRDRILVICGLAQKPQLAASVQHQLSRAGFREVYVLAGGLSAWTRARYPTVVAKGIEPPVHAPASAAWESHRLHQ
jgi:rhodanese-related sulfurtransferase